MLIECPSCARSYHVSRSAIGAAGRTVVCPRCAKRWFVEPEALPSAALEPGEEPGPSDIRASFRHDIPRRDRSAEPPHAATNTASRVPASATCGWTAVAASLACLALAMGLIAERTEIVRAAPRMATLYATIGLPVNTRALEFVDVKTLPAEDASRGVRISGTIRNLAHGRATLPRLTFDIRDAHGTTVTRWSDTAPKRILAADDSVAFASQAPAILPEGSKDIVVRFDASDAPAPTIGSLIHKRP